VRFYLIDANKVSFELLASKISWQLHDSIYFPSPQGPYPQIVYCSCGVDLEVFFLKHLMVIALPLKDD